jgi:acetolactate synthase-1/2/3 large subunit
LLPLHLQYNTENCRAEQSRFLGMVRQWQEIEYAGRYSSSYMDALPNFVKLAGLMATWGC